MTRFFTTYKSVPIVKKMVLTGIFLALVLVLQYLEKFMPFANTFIKINLSLVFILPIFYFCGPWLGILSLLLRFALGPAFSALGYTVISLIGHIILLISATIVIGCLYLYSLIFSYFKASQWKMPCIFLITLVTSALLLAFLNTFFFMPLYFYLFHTIPSFSYFQAVNLYESQSGLGWRIYFFGIPNYFWATFVTGLVANLVKYLIVFVAYFPLSKILPKFTNNEHKYEQKRGTKMQKRNVSNQ